jgi:hypothetical protein
LSDLARKKDYTKSLKGKSAYPPVNIAINDKWKISHDFDLKSPCFKIISGKRYKPFIRSLGKCFETRIQSIKSKNFNLRMPFATKLVHPAIRKFKKVI